MPKPTLANQTTELMGVFQHMLSLRAQFRAVAPENMATMRVYLDEERLKGKAGTMNFNLFYNVGAILSREAEPVTMGELGHALDVPLSTATRIVDWMVDRGYVRRIHDPNDRRVVRLSLTDNGQELYRTIDRFIRDRIEMILHELTPAERDSLLVLVHRLVDIVEKVNVGQKV